MSGTEMNRMNALAAKAGLTAKEWVLRRATGSVATAFLGDAPIEDQVPPNDDVSARDSGPLIPLPKQLNERIQALLAREGPLAASEVLRRLGASPSRARVALHQLKTRGAVTEHKIEKSTVYMNNDRGGARKRV